MGVALELNSVSEEDCAGLVITPGGAFVVTVIWLGNRADESIV